MIELVVLGKRKPDDSRVEALKRGIRPRRGITALSEENMIGRKWKEIVRAVWKRDREKCQNCWRNEEEVESLDVHHVVPRGKAGSHRYSNLILLCRRCHDAAHGRCMAPRIKWTTDGRMDSLEFSLSTGSTAKH